MTGYVSRYVRQEIRFRIKIQQSYYKSPTVCWHKYQLMGKPYWHLIIAPDTVGPISQMTAKGPIIITQKYSILIE